MKENTKTKLWIVLSIVVATCFFVAYSFQKNIIQLVLGCAWGCITVTRMISLVKSRKKEK